MRSFFYFVPNRHTLTLKEAASVGLAYAFERSIDCAQASGGGPGGQPGIVCAEADTFEPGTLGYHRDRQTWLQIPHSPLWVGFDTAAPPGPEDLARATQLAGHPLTLADDREWMVPVARSYTTVGEGAAAELRYSIQLPRRLSLAADGHWTTGPVLGRYAPLWELAENYLAVWSGTATPEQRAAFDDQALVAGASLALQANYRLGLAECSLLGMFTDSNIIDVLDRLIDLPTWHAFYKKKRSLAASSSPASPAGSASPAGPAGTTEPTGPPAPT